MSINYFKSKKLLYISHIFSELYLYKQEVRWYDVLVNNASGCITILLIILRRKNK